MRLASSKWFYLWSISPLGECLCPRGNFHDSDAHGNAYGGPLDCGASPGKHPHAAFRHGAVDALPYQELLAEHGKPGGLRRLAMCLQDTVMLDIDSTSALQSFYRIRAHVPKDNRLLGIAKTPRGFHVYLHCPEWTQKALNLAMKQWLGNGFWDPVESRKISRRGLVLDVRTGSNRYTVWPGEGSRDRHWVSSVEFRSALNFAGRGMPAARMVEDGALAPWNLEMNDQLRERIARAGADTVSRPALALDGSEADLDLAWRELERWARVLEKMDPETGRNNTLNQTAYHSGADAVAAGHAPERVRARLLEAAGKSRTPGAEATITSGLTSGLRDRHGRS